MLNKFASWVLSGALLIAAPLHAAQTTLPVYGYVVKNSYPHDTAAFTQGLFFKDGWLYESTGQNGHSSLRRVELVSGKVVQKKAIPAEFFGEGAAQVGNRIVSLTWTSKVGFIYDLKSFELKQRFNYEGEGWGLASDSAQRQLYMSDGSAAIRVLDPDTMAEVRRIAVTAEGKPLDRLNELEWVEGELFANVWGTDAIARIDPASGKVVGWIDLSGLLAPERRGTDSPDAVLNGIAYDSRQRRLFVTGKLWPKLFEIELVRIQKPQR
ncbi:MAG: glutaminyl-peptide cyclotransferase [Pseudomonadota bacterium]